MSLVLASVAVFASPHFFPKEVGCGECGVESSNKGALQRNSQNSGVASAAEVWRATVGSSVRANLPKGEFAAHTSPTSRDRASPGRAPLPQSASPARARAA